MKRSIWFWLCFAISIILSIYFATRIIMTVTGHGDISHVRNISISADQNDKDMSALASAAWVAPGTRSYSVDLSALNNRVSSVPGVRKSATRRLPNGNLSVRVSLYTAVALWTDGEHYYPLSADGTIVNRPTDARDIGNIVFRGPVPSDISDITNAAHNLIGALDYLTWVENRRWDLHTLNGITIMLPEKDAISAIGNLITINNTHKILGKDIHTIDMRDSSRILIK